MEGGVLNFDEVLPLKEHERVVVTIQPPAIRTQQSFGLNGWTGDSQVLRKIAEDDEFGAQESS